MKRTVLEQVNVLVLKLNQEVTATRFVSQCFDRRQAPIEDNRVWMASLVKRNYYSETNTC